MQHETGKTPWNTGPGTAGPAWPRRVEIVAEVDSTSLELRRRLERDPESASPAALLAAVQTGGRGRFDRSWVSPRGGLWLSIAGRLPSTADDERRVLTGLSLRVALGVLESLEAGLGSPPLRDSRLALKWPNDLVVLDAGHQGWLKVGGILIERLSFPSPWLIIGIGINANFPVSQLPSSLGASATTLRTALGVETDLAALAGRLLHDVAGAAASTGVPAAAFTSRMVGIDRPVSLRWPTNAAPPRGGWNASSGLVEGVLRGLSAESGLAMIELPSGMIVESPPGAVIM